MSFSDVSVGNNFAAAVDINGSVWTWGNNIFGQLGIEDTDARPFPTNVKTLRGKHV